MGDVLAVSPVVLGPVQPPVRAPFSTLVRVDPGPGGETSRAVALPEVRGGPARGRVALEPEPLAQALDRIQVAQTRMEAVLRLAASGRSFTPAELLALQAGVTQASHVLDLSGRLVERTTSAVKQVLQTQA